MTVYDFIAKWIKEAQAEFHIAKSQQNTFKMIQSTKILRKLSELKDTV